MGIESEKDLRGLMKIGRVVGLAMRIMQERLKPGMTTGELDQIGGAVLKQHGAQSAPYLTYRFPGVTCISVNDQAAHGVPGERAIQAGDLVKIDVSAELDGYFADAAITVAVPPVSAAHQRLCECARAALEAGIAAALADRPINAIGRAAESAAQRYGFQIIRELPGHGVGRALHEAPRAVPMFFDRQARLRLQEGLVITIEPHIAAGAGAIVTDPDGWTLKTRDGSHAAAFEHTVIITRGQPIVVTAI